MPSTTESSRWSFPLPSPLGMTTSSYELTVDALVYETDDVMGGGGDRVRWDDIREAGTAAMAGAGGRGAPDMPTWAPARLEWLLVGRVDGRTGGFMRRLPEGADRDALIDALRVRLGGRWIGEGLPLPDAQQRLGITSPQWNNLKLAGVVLAVLGLLALSIIVLGLLLTPIIFIPVGTLVGGWLVRRGVEGWRASETASSKVADRIGSALPGLVHVEGRALAPSPSPSRSAVTDRPCVWWDVSVSLRYVESDGARTETWRQVASRYGGIIDVVTLADDTGQVSVWLKDAQLLLARRSWESNQDELPPAGIALLDELGFPWHGTQKILVTEECLEADAALYVIGTLDVRRNLPEAGDAGWIERVTHSLRTGAWRRHVVGAAPPQLRVVLAVFIGYIDMLTRFGIAKARPWQMGLAAPPSLAPDARVLWKGRGARPFLVSDRPESTALAALRKRSLIVGGIGVAILLFMLDSLVEVFHH